MSMRQIELAPEAEPILDAMTAEYGGNMGQALSELLLTREFVEAFADELESENAAELIQQRDAAEHDFAAGRGIPWEEIKLKHRL